MRPLNTVFILSDEHNRDCLGCYGSRVAITPNLDRLADEGVRFANAYTNSPVCVPARASLASGRYPHRIRAWDSVSPYDGTVKGWGGRLIDAGREVVSVGKLHFRSAADDNGFCREILPMHVHEGVGWKYCLLRNPPEPMASAKDLAEEIGPGESSYTRYDRKVTRRACDWIAEAAGRRHDFPWTLFVGLVAPHYPLVAPRKFFDLYDGVDIPGPILYGEAERPRHPVLEGIRAGAPYDENFNAERVLTARKSYFGLCSFLDDNVGQILRSIADSGQKETTRVIYSSDHGECLGNRGLWTKSVMYEDAVAIPLIVSAPDLPSAEVARTPVSLVDLHPTLTEFAGLTRHRDDVDLPGESLAKAIRSPDLDRTAFSEYHDWCAITGMFMVRKGNWKLVQYPGFPSQLFNLAEDPHELIDLINRPELGGVIAKLEAETAKIVDIRRTNDLAFSDQAEKIKLHGGREAILAGADQGYTPPPGVT